MDASYNDASTQALARMYSTFYRELLLTGMPPAAALELTKTYIQEISRGANELNARRNPEPGPDPDAS